MQNNIKFVIHIPAYNVEKSLEKCVNSVLGQSYKNFIIVITDDGSTDNTTLLCDEISKKDNRIIVYHKVNEGLLLTRRYSIDRNHGEWNIFLDSLRHSY